MYPITFHPNERVLSPPPGQHEEISCLRVVDITYADGTPGCISCWQLTAEDIQRIQETGKLYICVLGRSQPPILPTVSKEELGL